jgi:hypothetical protein
VSDSPIPGLLGYYVSRDGAARGPRGPLKPGPDGSYSVRGRTYGAARLVALTYLGPAPAGLTRAVLVDPSRPPSVDNVAWGAGGRPRGRVPGSDRSRLGDRQRARLEAAVQAGLFMFEATGDVSAAITAAAEQALCLARRPAPLDPAAPGG